MKSKKIMQSTLALALVFGAASYIGGCSCNNTVEEKSEQQKLYDLYVAYTSAKGETPQTYEEWLASIKGEKGEDGNSLLTGEGTPQNTLGKIGDTYLNKTTYDLYEKKTSGWELIGNIKGLDGSSQGGKTITDVDAQFNTDIYGNRYVVFTFTYSDGSSDDVTIAMPREIVDIELLGADNVVNGEYVFTKLEQGVEAPKLKLHVIYDDNTSMDIDLNDQMINQKLEPVNFYEAKNEPYRLEVNFQGRKKDFSIRVVDPSNLPIASIDLLGYNGGPRFLIQTGESLDATASHYEKVYVKVNYVNGKTSYVSLKKLIEDNVIELENFQGDCHSDIHSCSATIRANNDVNIVGNHNNITFQTFTDYSQLQLQYISYENNSYYDNGPSFAKKVGENLFDEGEYIGFGVIVNYKDGGAYNLYLPVESLTLKNSDGDTEFNKDQKGVGNYYFEYDNHQFQGKTIRVNMYDENEVEVMLVAQSGNDEVPGIVNVRVNQASKETVYLSIKALANNSGIEFEATLNDLNIIDDDGLDFNNAGIYNISYEYKGYSGTLKVNVFNPDICNIQSLMLPTTLIVTQNTNLNEFLQTIYGQSLHVTYYEDYHGHNEGEVEIVEAMVDARNLDLTQIGNQTITITYGLPYQGDEGKVSINVVVKVVPDVSTAQELKTYQYESQLGDYFPRNYVFDSITTYDNNIAVLKNSEEAVDYVSYTLQGDILSFTLDGVNLYFKTNNEGGQEKITNYAPQGSVQESYKISYHINVPSFSLDAVVQFNLEIYSDSELTANNSYYAIVSIPAELVGGGGGLDIPYYTVKVNLQENGKYTIEGSDVVYNLDGDVLTQVTE